MSSLPNQTNHLSTPVGPRTHRHRRSAAISGDFDAMGLGLFSPSPSSKSMSNININNSNKASETEDEKHFNFNNLEDFTNKQSSTDFSFPVKTPEIGRNAAGSSPRNYNTVSPARKTMFHSASNSLNSPIKLNHRRASSYSSATTKKNKFFATEESTMNSENVPEAVIDLDEILNANLHIGGGYSSSNLSTASLNHNKTELVPPEIFSDDDFLASPFVQQSSSSFVSSPLTSVSGNYSSNILNHGTGNASHLLFNQPIQENTGDLIEEEEDDEGLFEDQREQSLEYIQSDNENSIDVFANMPPSHVLGNGLYSNLSANSSSSSLRSTSKPSNLIEKTFSNSSRDSANSSHYVTNSNTPTLSMLNNSTPTGKRSGAKANRYQIFYDQSNRISNALRVSSSESVNIVRSNSGNNFAANPHKESRSLGHSSSLPSLKSNPKRSLMQRQTPSRFGDVRSITPDYKRVPSPPFLNNQEKFGLIATSPVLTTSQSTELKSTPINSAPSQESSINVSKGAALPSNKGDKVNGSIADDLKNKSASPISNHSDSAISSSETMQSTDSSCLSSHHELASKAKPTREVSRNHALSSPTTLNEVYSNSEGTIIDRSVNKTPSIVVSSGCEGTSSPSTSSTFKQDYFSGDQNSQDVVHNDSTLVAHDDSIQGDETSNHTFSPQSPTTSNTYQTILVDSCSSSVNSSVKSSPRRGSRRPMSSSEERILKMTQIPVFKTSSATSRRSQLINSQPDSPHNATIVISKEVDVPQIINTPPQEDKQEGKIKSNYNPFAQAEMKNDTSNSLQGPTENGKASAKSSKKGPIGQRRGSESISILSSPVLTDSNGSSSLLRGPHSKSRSFSISLHDLTPKFSRSSSSIADEGRATSKKKTNKLINWFRRK